MQEPEGGGHQAFAVILLAEVPEALRGLGEEAVLVGIGAQGEFLAGEGAADGVLAKEFVEQGVAVRAREVGERTRPAGCFRWPAGSSFH